MPLSPIVIHAPHLTPTARRLAAENACSWSASKAVRSIWRLDELAHAIGVLAGQVATSKVPEDLLVAIAGMEAELLITVRCTRVLAHAAGSHLPASAADRLDRFPDDGALG